MGQTIALRHGSPSLAALAGDDGTVFKQAPNARLHECHDIRAKAKCVLVETLPERNTLEDYAFCDSRRFGLKAKHAKIRNLRREIGKCPADTVLRHAFSRELRKL